MLPTFAAIPSYDDSDTPRTVASMRDNAHGPLRVIVVLQSDNSALESAIRRAGAEVIRTPREDAVGCCWPRWRAQQEYRGERWYYQCDAHSRFEDGWDEWFQDHAPPGDRWVLTHFPHSFKGGKGTQPGGVRITPHEGGSWLFEFQGYTPKISVKRSFPVTGISGGNLFAPGWLCHEVPNFPELSQGADQHLYSVKLWTSGWDLYSPPEPPVVSHWYGAERDDHRTPWSDGLEKWKKASAREHEALVDTFLHEKDDWIGKRRTIRDWKEWSGVRFVEGRADVSPRDYGAGDSRRIVTRSAVADPRAILAAADGMNEDDGRVGSGTLNHSARDSQVRWLPISKAPQITDDIFGFIRMASVALGRPVRDPPCDSFQITRYRSGRGHYRWHRDSAMDETRERTVSVSMLLSGGRDQFEIEEIGPVSQSPGDIVAFPSDSLHRVTAGRGERISLVGWGLRKPWPKVG